MNYMGGLAFQQRQKNTSRNQPTAMDLYFLDWVRTRDKTEPETRDAHKISPHGTMTKLETTRSAGVGGSGLALAILVGLGRVGQPELKESPQATRGKKKKCCLKENLGLIEKRFAQMVRRIQSCGFV